MKESLARHDSEFSYLRPFAADAGCKEDVGPLPKVRAQCTRRELEIAFLFCPPLLVKSARDVYSVSFSLPWNFNGERGNYLLSPDF